MAFNRESDKGDAPRRRVGTGIRRRKKVCVFCGKDNEISYKDPAKLKKYVSERGKILPRRVTGCCAKHQENQQYTYVSSHGFSSSFSRS